MDELSAEPRGTVVSFVRHGTVSAGLAFAACFTPRDRMEISDWRDAARTAGYDRMIIHDRDYADALEVGNFLSVYRRGDSWSRWGFARRGRTISGWCCLTSIDMGCFDTLHDALGTVLGGAPGRVSAMMVSAGQPTAEVTQLASYRLAWSRRLGSAA